MNNNVLNNENEQKLSKEQLNQIINLLASNGINIDLNNKKEEDWKTQLSTNKFGYLPTIVNYRLWLENGSKRYTNKIKYNSFFDYLAFLLYIHVICFHLKAHYYYCLQNLLILFVFLLLQFLLSNLEKFQVVLIFHIFLFL